MICSTEISIQCSSWNLYKESINSKNLNMLLNTVLKRYRLFNLVSKIELSLLLTNDLELQKLNLQFRGVNKITNVLSFPDKSFYWQDMYCALGSHTSNIYLGDIAFAYDYIEHESCKLQKNFLFHFKHLFVHSVLHLIGYDHITREDADLMEYLEKEILIETLEKDVFE